jgi:hypothetical protein
MLDVAYVEFAHNEVPQAFYVDKGVVTVDSSDDNFWISYNKSDEKFITCTIKEGKLNVVTQKDNLDIRVNLRNLSVVKLTVDAGMININYLPENFDVVLRAGVVKVKTDKKNIGNLVAEVAVGSVSNNSSANQEKGANLTQGISNRVALSGDKANYVANFKIGSGVFSISDD